MQALCCEVVDKIAYASDLKVGRNWIEICESLRSIERSIETSSVTWAVYPTSLLDRGRQLVVECITIARFK